MYVQCTKLYTANAQCPPKSSNVTWVSDPTTFLIRQRSPGRSFGEGGSGWWAPVGRGLAAYCLADCQLLLQLSLLGRARCSVIDGEMDESCCSLVEALRCSSRRNAKRCREEPTSAGSE